VVTSERSRGKVVVVTGASRGIGAATALEFAREGANLVLAARTTEQNPHHVLPGTLEDTAAQCRAQGAEVVLVQADVSHEEDVRKIRDETFARFGRCDVVVNNAAVSYVGPLLDLTVKRWDILMGVNVRGPMMMTQAFLPDMLKRGDGRIINISSADGRLDYDPAVRTEAERALKLIAYGTSKAALNRMTKGLAVEYGGQGVAFNALEVSALVEIYRINVPEADYSHKELPEAPAQLVTWLAAQPATFSGHVLVQRELLAELRPQGVVRAKVDPQ
jgi:NAD(P)-dependent dehydrogenase (short-subunit alcohol dehydrogenase family)